MARAKTKITMSENEVNSELSDENHDLKDEIKELKIEQKFFNELAEMKATLIRIETKVQIHNNYEQRIRDNTKDIQSLNEDKSKFNGVFNALKVVIPLLAAAVGAIIAHMFWKP